MPVASSQLWTSIWPVDIRLSKGLGRTSSRSKSRPGLARSSWRAPTGGPSVLEDFARGLGVHRLVLETGIYQAEAIGLYRRAGFRPIRCWGEYAEAVTSVCFEKTV